MTVSTLEHTGFRSRFTQGIKRLAVWWLSMGILSLVSPTKALTILRITLGLNGKKELKKLLSYQTIELRTFLEIAETGNMELMGGKPNERNAAWEEIVKRNGASQGSTLYTSYKEEIKGLNQLLVDYHCIKAALTKLVVVGDYEKFKWLKKKGYKFDTSSVAAYRKSLVENMNISNNMATRIQMKRAAMLKLIEQNQGSDKMGLQEMLAEVGSEIGFDLPDDIKLAKYNSYRDKIKAKRKSKKKQPWQL